MDKSEERHDAAGGEEESTPEGRDLNRQNKEETWSVIQAFEEILKVMPDDLSSLESLWRAYSDYGDDAKALEYLLQLGRSVEEEGDVETARRIISSLPGAVYDDQRVEPLVDSLRNLCSEHEVAREKTQESTQRPLRVKPRVPDELSFAWYLMESGMLSSEEYAQIADDLAEMSARGRQGTISVLHALDARTFPRMESLIEFVSHDLSVPYINLKAFDVGADVVRLLPSAFILGRGVLPFETLGKKDVLVAVLNPFDKSVMTEVAEVLGMNCHFYVISPQDFDEVVKKLFHESRKPASDGEE